jgi:hypothetical protein
MLQTLPQIWVRDFDFQLLAPNQKNSFKSLVDGWAAMILNNVSARLGETNTTKAA